MQLKTTGIKSNLNLNVIHGIGVNKKPRTFLQVKKPYEFPQQKIHMKTKANITQDNLKY